LDSDAVAARPGELPARLVMVCEAAGDAATGGHGPSALLDAPGAVGNALHEEVTAGTPLGTRTGANNHGLPVVTKAGGYGAPDVLGAVGIALVDEVTGGMPLGTLTGGKKPGLPVVTKAGGFGAADVLIKAAKAVRERRLSL